MPNFFFGLKSDRTKVPPACKPFFQAVTNFCPLWLAHFSIILLHSTAQQEAAPFRHHTTFAIHSTAHPAEAHRHHTMSRNTATAPPQCGKPLPATAHHAHPPPAPLTPPGHTAGHAEEHPGATGPRHVPAAHRDAGPQLLGHPLLGALRGLHPEGCVAGWVGLGVGRRGREGPPHP